MMRERPVIDPRLDGVDSPASAQLSKDLWQILCSREAVSAAEAFSDVELPAVAGLSGMLIREFPKEIADEAFRKEVGWLMRRVMEHPNIGYLFDRKDVQINLPGIFSTGAVYRLKGTYARDRTKRISRADREAWAENRKAPS